MEDVKPGRRNPQNFLAQFLNEGIYRIKEDSQKPVPYPGIEKESETKKVNEPGVEKIPHFGENSEHILLLLSYKKNTSIIIKDKLFLKNILTAINLDFKSVAVVNVQWVQQPFHALVERFDPAYVLAFGVSDNYFSFETREYEWVKTGGLQVAVYSPLYEIASSRQMKRKLWNVLNNIINT